MTARFIRGIGRADWTPVEDELAYQLLEQGRPDEVAFLHALKTTFDARAVESDDCWHRERAAAAIRQRDRQEALQL